MFKIRKNFIQYLFPLTIIAVTILLCFKNYTPGTYLIGWDSLHPEFNFPEAFRRATDGVFRMEQGVGAVAAHSHMADLPRIIFLWLESFVLPVSFLRYSYIFLCLILGPLGVYFFLKYVFQIEKESVWIFPAAFLGALFYLLNLGTLQNFFVPFEMFPAAFAFTPWLIFSGLKYIREGKRPNLIFWSIVVILSSPMAYASTLWYATFAGIFIFFTTYLIVSPAKKIKLGKLIKLGAIAVFLNLFWILPNIYSIVTQSSVISNSNINRLFSSEAFLRNRDYGDFKDILLQKNFLFGWRNFDFAKNQFVDLLDVWIKYLSIPAVVFTGYILSGVSILGFITGILKRQKVALAFIPFLLFCLFFLVNINPPIGGLYSYLYNNFRVFAEGFRMPFTKFSVLFEVVASFYFGYFAFVFLTLKARPLKAFVVFIKILFFAGGVTGLIYFMLPAFNGWLVGHNVRLEFPSEYRQMFSWFNTHPEGRVALFPINSKYGWEYRNWGYEGSGFLTYGTRDTILYRDFDRWSVGNENFFNQVSFALYSDDSEAFLSTLKKYQVKYLLIDESIVNPGGNQDILKIQELKNIFVENGIKQVASFGFLTIYETGFGGEVSTPSQFVRTNSDFSYSPIDPIYITNGDYVGPDKPVRIVPNLPSGYPSVFEDLSVNRGFPSAFNCDLKKAGKVSKNNSSDGILFRAENGGASCDYLSYPELNYSQAYVLRIAGENKQGRSLKIYLFNEKSQVPDLEEILPAGKFDESYFIYSKNVTGSGYILNLETRSFGRLSSENLLSKVEFYAVDFNYLQNLQGDILSNNDLKITNVKKYGTWMYIVDVQDRGLIQLDQGFDPGWIGFMIQDLRFKVLEHVKVNSWSNGWLLNPEILDQRSVIYILFWPQLLEWGGALLGITTLFWILKKPRGS
ncbi:MAG: hypothetical protein HYV90_05825 [Candidatus Woesebacteria bacterium]|nr:MAG: hypothetical protein HYV90_05825 [Candidatus Woesebacteria bacterium]